MNFGIFLALEMLYCISGMAAMIVAAQNIIAGNTRIGILGGAALGSIAIGCKAIATAPNAGTAVLYGTAALAICAFCAKESVA